jgi:plasmid stabilization system protein ParE
VKWNVSIREAAKTDLGEARDWYQRQRPGLGDEFLLSVTEALSQLEESPERFPIYYKDFRRILTDRFPYKVFYRIEGIDVIVFRVLHSARDHTWQLR